jgi:tetratricopeptide (TPR) repeat protein
MPQTNGPATTEQSVARARNAWASAVVRAVLIVLLTVVTYLPAMRGGFVFDDNMLIVDNRLVKASDGLRRFWLTTDAADYYPLTQSLWWLEWRSWGANPLGYHVVNVFLHAVNAVLMWLALRRLKIPGAWVAGLVFAVHPVNVATVAWISEQKNTLSMLFSTVAILSYLKFDENNRWRWYGLSLAAFVLALFSKTAVVMLPVVLLGCVWWLHGRVRWKDLLRSLPFFALSLISGVITIWFQSGAFARSEGLTSRLAEAGLATWFYLYKAILPIDLTVIYPKWEIDPDRWISCVPGLLLCVCFAVLWRNRNDWGRPLLFGLGWFVVMLFPVLGFFDQGFYQYALVADHWQYYSIGAVIALAVASVIQLSRRWGERGRYGAIVATVVVLVVLGTATWRRSCVYADSETLWRDNVAKNPNSWAAYNNLGTTLWQSGRAQEAIAYWEQALRIKPDYPEAHNNLASPLAQAGRFNEAIEHYEQALQTKPDYVEVHHNLGLILAHVGRLAEAIGHYEQAVRIKPDYVEAHYDLAVAYEQTGRRQDAIEHYEQALKLRPDFTAASNALARLRAAPISR